MSNIKIQLNLFNSPLETGIRTLIILLENFPSQMDIQRLIFFDYFVVHSEDIDGPSSLHPPTPNRSGEVFVRRDVINQGIKLMVSRSLIDEIYTIYGIYYKASENAYSFLECLESIYIYDLRSRARWVCNYFKEKNNDEITTLFSNGLNRWGSELSNVTPEYEEGS